MELFEEGFAFLIFCHLGGIDHLKLYENYGWLLKGLPSAIEVIVCNQLLWGLAIFYVL